MKFRDYDTWLDVFERAVWTFLQAFLAVWVVTGEPFSKVTLAASFAAGVSALKNFIKNTL